MWTIVFLAMGGIALGKGVVSSGLLEVMDVLIRKLVDGQSLFSIVLLLAPVVLVCVFNGTLLGPEYVLTMYISDCIYLHQPYHRQCSPCTHCQRGWLESEVTHAWSPCQPANFYYRSNMFCGDGNACLRISQPDRVRSLTYRPNG
jgi:hypothetical protein